MMSMTSKNCVIKVENLCDDEADAVTRTASEFEDIPMLSSGKTSLVSNDMTFISDFSHSRASAGQENTISLPTVSEAEPTRLPEPSVSWAGKDTKCNMEDLVALEFAEMERVITTGHRHVLQVLRSSGKNGTENGLPSNSTLQGFPSASNAPFYSGGTESMTIKIQPMEPQSTTIPGFAPLPGQLGSHDKGGAGACKTLVHASTMGASPSGNGNPMGQGNANVDCQLKVPAEASASLGGFNGQRSHGVTSFNARDPSTFATMITHFDLLPHWCSKYTDEYTKAAQAGTHRGSDGGLMGKLHSQRSSVGKDGKPTQSYSVIFHQKTGHCTERCDLQRFVIHPCAGHRAVWDVFSLLLVVYDIAILPLQFFEPEDNTFSILMTWVTRIFWTIDLFMSFFTGYLLTDGFIMMVLKTIVLHYVKTWFILDCCLVSCDWTEFVISEIIDTADASTAGEATGLGRLGKAGRIVRILRMIRLLRMARMREIIRVFTFRMTSEKLAIIADISKCLAFIIAVAHLLACCWYGICNSDNAGETSWITQSGVRDEDMAYKYMLSLHWSLSQFQGGMDEFKASTFIERLFAVVAFLFAFMLAAVCVSALTSSMTRLHILTSHQSRQISILRRYLIQNGISDKLSLRVQRNALHAISEQQRLMAESKVELLHAISDPLKVELHFEMYGPVLEVHPFFEAYILSCPHVMHHICHQAMSTLLVSHGDIIFNLGEIPPNPRMYIVCNGHFEYVSGFNETTPLLAKDYVAEAALWTHWMHRGALKALTDGRLCVMQSRRFGEIVRSFEHPEFQPRLYAAEYIKKLNQKTEQGSPITDLPLGLEGKLKECANCHKKAEGRRFARFMKKKMQSTVDMVAPNAMRAKGSCMMDTPRRQSVLFGGEGGKRASKMLKFESEVSAWNQALNKSHKTKTGPLLEVLPPGKST